MKYNQNIPKFQIMANQLTNKLIKSIYKEKWYYHKLNTSIVAVVISILFMRMI